MGVSVSPFSTAALCKLCKEPPHMASAMGFTSGPASPANATTSERERTPAIRCEHNTNGIRSEVRSSPTAPPSTQGWCQASRLPLTWHGRHDRKQPITNGQRTPQLRSTRHRDELSGAFLTMGFFDRALGELLKAAIGPPRSSSRRRAPRPHREPSPKDKREAKRAGCGCLLVFLGLIGLGMLLKASEQVEDGLQTQRVVLGGALVLLCVVGMRAIVQTRTRGLRNSPPPTDSERGAARVEPTKPRSPWHDGAWPCGHAKAKHELSCWRCKQIEQQRSRAQKDAHPLDEPDSSQPDS